ncbi:neprilysin-1-like [Dermacentor andersoni]|uniref:neprilysin-1-like n=1 Tax=Dermacentor andersoni TaxID=34620 RepID=UPI002155DF02|nr:neprilysin-1-like [Dermacentor andersoni]
MSTSPKVVVVLLIGVLYGAGWVLLDRLTLLAYPWCDHPLKCYDYAQELAASVDKSVDPCDNLYEYVCAQWPRRYPAHEHHFELVGARTKAFLLHQLEHPGFDNESLAVRRTVAGYRACVSAFRERREDIQVLFDVLKKFNVTWPSSTLPKHFDVMEYLLGLSLDYNLGTPLLLRMEPYLKTDRRYGLSLNFVMPSKSHLLNFVPSNAAACMLSVVPSIGHDSASRFGETIYRVYTDLAMNLQEHFAKANFTQSYATIGELARNLSRRVADGALLNAINKHLPQDMQVDNDEEMLVFNNTYLVVNEMLKTANRSHSARLVLFSGWNMIVMYNFGMSSSLLDCTHTDPSLERSTLAAGTCLGAMNEVAGYALARFFVDRAAQSRAVLDVKDTWNAVRDATRRNFPTLSWMDQSTAAGAINHVDNLVSIIALPAHLNSSQALDALYDYLEANQSQPFFHWFMKSRKQQSDKLKRLILEDPNVQVHREDMPLSSVQVNAFYLRLYHIMAILPAIMAPPYVSPGLAPAVNYGSIGKILGHELSHAFDPRFTTQTRTGDFATWWSQSSYANFKDRLECVRSQLANYTDSESHGFNALSETFADTAGTEKARLAYDSLPSQPGMLGYSQEQLFFVAGCFEFCAKSPYSWEALGKYPAFALRCNLPVSNHKNFAKAFKCPTGTALNPPKRCSFH